MLVNYLWSLDNTACVRIITDYLEPNIRQQYYAASLLKVMMFD